MSETKRVRWDDVFDMNVYEFFSIIAYAKEKGRRQKERFDKQWKRP